MWALDQVKRHDYGILLRDARDFALTNGMVMRSTNIPDDNQVNHVPFTLFPTPFPSRIYQECLDVQPIINTLLFKIANDHQFMEGSLSSVIQVDEFTNNLMNINKAVLKEGLAQPVISCISRSDYLLNKDLNGYLNFKQVEVNAIASGMSSHSHNIERLHDYLMNKYNIEQHPIGFTKVSQNQSLKLVAQGLIDARDSYKGGSSSYILLVAEDRSLNFADHFQLESMVSKLRSDVKFVRKRFCDLSAKIDDKDSILKLGPNKELIIDGDKEIAVVYFRYCYDPSNYSLGERSWKTRLTIERSRAIKCPSINFHLSGAKKFQQVLHKQQDLEKFLNNNDAKRLSNAFCKFWSVDNDEGFKMGMSSPESLVLKPQREGGGHNIFGQDIPDFLEHLPDGLGRAQYILMEHINSPFEKNWLLLHQDEPDDILNSLSPANYHQLSSELGIYGSVLGERNNIRSNKSAGYLIRSKKIGVNEGGVAAGFAGLSSLMLYDDARDNLDSSIYYVR